MLPQAYGRLRRVSKNDSPGLLEASLDPRNGFFGAQQLKFGYRYYEFANAVEFLKYFRAEKERVEQVLQKDYRPTWNELLLEHRRLKPYVDIDIKDCEDVEKGQRVLEEVIEASCKSCTIAIRSKSNPKRS